MIRPYYEFPNILLNGFQNNETTTTFTINECWNLCETNSLIKCAAISFHNYHLTCLLYDTEFFEKRNFDKNTEFTTLMRKSKFLMILIHVIYLNFILKGFIGRSNEVSPSCLNNGDRMSPEFCECKPGFAGEICSFNVASLPENSSTLADFRQISGIMH